MYKLFHASNSCSIPLFQALTTFICCFPYLYSEVSDLICNTSEYKYGKQQIKVVNAWNNGIEQELLAWNSLYMYFACSCSYNSDLEYAQEYLSLSNDLFHTYQNKLDKYCVKYKL